MNSRKGQKKNKEEDHREPRRETLQDYRGEFSQKPISANTLGIHPLLKEGLLTVTL